MKKRAKLTIIEAKDKTIIVKFGPDEYAKDMNKFMNMFFAAVMQMTLVLSKLSSDEESRQALYDHINLNFSKSLDLAFPDVIEKILKEESLEQLVVEAVEDGEEISEEAKKNIEKMKKEVSKRFKSKESATSLEKLEKSFEDLDNDIKVIKRKINKIIKSGVSSMKLNPDTKEPDYKKIEKTFKKILNDTFELKGELRYKETRFKEIGEELSHSEG